MRVIGSSLWSHTATIVHYDNIKLAPLYQRCRTCRGLNMMDLIALG